ncbi:hypothetical protein JTB14_002292 [Gonioctena quinquepunctata]|nr:hypothetical protein JTB14_002292 [Gonioctena quinquepunctata]
MSMSGFEQIGGSENAENINLDDTYSSTEVCKESAEVPYTPELNGQAECLERSIAERARAMLCDSGMD